MDIFNRVVPIQASYEATILHPMLKAKMKDYRMRLSVFNAGYAVLTDWHPMIPNGWGSFPEAPFERVVIYRGDANSWAYSHHQAITKFGDRYVASWSSGYRHEDYAGQEVHLAWSVDTLHWSEPAVVAQTPVESRLVRNNAGLCAANGRLYCYVGVAKDSGRDVSPPGMSTLKEQPVPLDCYVTEDLRHWEHVENICENVYLFEGPRPTRDGKYLCCGFDLLDNHAVVLIWDDPATLSARPRVVDIPLSPYGLLPVQGSWYQTDDGGIWMYQRDSSLSCRLGLTHSEDGGETWSDLIRTDFPNSYSRAFAGRLSDGRCYIVGNNYDIFLDRRHLLIAISDDGHVFDRQYTLIEGETTRRIDGQHKEDGFHYPNCLADGDNLVVIYSVNKEDIEVGIVDMNKVEP